MPEAAAARRWRLTGAGIEARKLGFATLLIDLHACCELDQAMPSAQQRMMHS